MFLCRKIKKERAKHSFFKKAVTVPDRDPASAPDAALAGVVPDAGHDADMVVADAPVHDVAAVGDAPVVAETASVRQTVTVAKARAAAVAVKVLHSRNHFDTVS